ncbi:hypothetical protein CP8484711_1162B, partial [Chlamydia psittaci 84-8471/1]
TNCSNKHGFRVILSRVDHIRGKVSISF